MARSRRGAGTRAGIAAAVVLAGAAAGVAAWRGGGKAPAPDATWDEAKVAFEAGRYQGAEAALARLAAQRPPTPADHYLRAQLAVVRGRTDAALAELAAVAEGHPAAARSFLQAGQLELRRDRVRVAEGWYRRALKADSGAIQARRELVFILGLQLRRRDLAEQFYAMGRAGVLTFDDVYLWGLSASGLAWDPAGAAEYLEKFVKADPEDRWSRLALAEDLRRLGSRAEAEAMLAPLPESDAEARVLRAQLALDRNDLESVAGLLAGGPADDPALEKFRGRWALSRGDAAGAVEHFRVARRGDPDDRESVLGLGQALLRVGRPDEARPWLEAARHIDALSAVLRRAGAGPARKDPRLVHELGSASAAAGRLREARAWYRLALKRDALDPEAQRALFRLGADDEG